MERCLGAMVTYHLGCVVPFKKVCVLEVTIWSHTFHVKIWPINPQYTTL